MNILRDRLKKSSEPLWLSTQRESAWKKFESLPFPTSKDEEWRYTNLKQFSLESFDFAVEEEAAENVQKDLPEGVIVCDVKEALQKHAVLIQPVLKEIQSRATSKFESLHQALWHGGTFIYVPKGLELKEPIYTLTRLSPSQGVIFPFTIVVVEPMAKVSVIDESVSEETDTKQFSNGYRYLRVKEQAELQYVNIQRYGKNVVNFETQLSRVDKGGRFNSVNVGLGSHLTKANVHTILEGSGAEAKPLGVFFGDKDQHFDYYTIQDHAHSDTQSDLLFKSALKDHAQSSYQGVIRIPKESQRSDAYQANRNLLLSEHAKARTSPKLEIIADDVRCTHGATVGTVDANETFYLQSRGLSKEEAVRMIVLGFFEQVLERIPAQDIRERLHETVKDKLEGR